MKYHKKIRLKKETYREQLPCSLTICTDKRKEIFENKELASYCTELIKSLCEEHEFIIYAYCFMPDHLHLLIRRGGDLSIIELIQRFKSISTLKSYEYGFAGKIYQTSFYDHFLRKEEDIEKHVRYILENPIRKGMANSISEYPFQGSLVFDLNE